ncbi:MAG: hypothetical protein ACKOOL_11930 [Novosphingobium sp.]
MKRIAIWGVVLSIVLGAGSCERPSRWPRMSLTDKSVCEKSGGHEGREPFGAPICVPAFKDGGKTCLRKADCEGRCLSDAPDNYKQFTTGSPVTGQCESEATMFGCHANVEEGKLTEDYFCEA